MSMELLLLVMQYLTNSYFKFCEMLEIGAILMIQAVPLIYFLKRVPKSLFQRFSSE